MRIGVNSYISPRAKIIDLAGNVPEDFVIGDNSYIGDDVQIICDSFHLGDYCKLHHHCNVHGKSVHIGHNAWIGQYTILDGLGGIDIGDNCGIGAHSQLWSHIKYGDILEGCRFESTGKLSVGKDVWFVGHCIISPINAADKSMALVGSVVTKDMINNHVYAGSPAKDITDKVGPQFVTKTIDEKMFRMSELCAEFGTRSSIIIVPEVSDIRDDGQTYFIVSKRQYTKRLTTEEVAFMKFLLPTRAKFTPYTGIL